MVSEQIAARGIHNTRVIEAIRRVPRHLFVPPEQASHAYEDNPLPIGSNQTISQPYMVAVMTNLLNPQPQEKVLEIGVGSGYQSAVLAQLAARVIGIERIARLARNATERLKALGISNVEVITGDGSGGYPAEAPYDGILVAAVAPRVPDPLVEQLRDGGRLVIPVWDADEQMIELAWRSGGTIHIRRLFPVRFVPLIGRHGYRARKAENQEPDNPEERLENLL